ncbi:hypothetical protein [[Mycobacterium] zoologicum]|uniref:hypothetical protein n=1 Tax=[Mycobacterium] zoologicum TaxID=2872311 RepID=UPI002C10FD7B|nr:hypothetical protein [Mycolicibacter sp. MYC101]MEB3065065.1 hypothetical protein [Mycolicibacter sp. MYC101]
MTGNAPVTAFRLKLTPRQRELLLTHLWVNADNAYDDIEEHGDQPVDEDSGRWWMILDRLPEQTWGLPAWWRRQLARAFDDLALDLEAGRLPRPRSVAEEVALVIAVAGAQAAMIDRQYNEDVEALPAASGDEDWQTAIDALIGNQRVDWDMAPGDSPEWVGEIPPPATWFNPFDNSETRPPERGFRR